MPFIAYAERRQHARFDTEGLLVVLRKKGRLSKLTGMAADFNRFGLALVIDQPLPKDCTVYLTITCTDQKIDHVVGVVHNCVSLEVGYRCGIQFRTASELQEDREQIEKSLIVVEELFASQTSPA